MRDLSSEEKSTHSESKGFTFRPIRLGFVSWMIMFLLYLYYSYALFFASRKMEFISKKFYLKVIRFMSKATWRGSLNVMQAIRFLGATSRMSCT
jgi:uncharacterized RDD family membrane protein YckC